MSSVPSTETSMYWVIKAIETQFDSMQSNMKGLLGYVSKTKETIDFTNIQQACSTVYSNHDQYVNYAGSIGSGCFVRLSEDPVDLANGWFITAAHCVMKSSEYAKKQTVYLTNPLDDTWFKAGSDQIYLDGVSDIALIKTNIDFQDHPEYCIPLASSNPNSGDVCYICGNPGGFDNDSLTKGVVRDAHFTLFPFVTDAIHINAPGTGGNSGSPIVNIHGEIIGLFTFGVSDHETFNGGPNLDTLKSSLLALSRQEDYRSKYYLGINWYLPNAFDLARYYLSSETKVPNRGIVVKEIDATDSPFYGVLQSNDLLLSISTKDETYDLGVLPSQRTPGILLYSSETTVTIEYIRLTTKHTASITLQKKYSDVSSSLDMPLVGGAPRV